MWEADVLSPSKGEVGYRPRRKRTWCVSLLPQLSSPPHSLDVIHLLWVGLESDLGPAGQGRTTTVQYKHVQAGLKPVHFTHADLQMAGNGKVEGRVQVEVYEEAQSGFVLAASDTEDTDTDTDQHSMPRNKHVQP
jgi:hypothetical protein